MRNVHAPAHADGRYRSQQRDRSDDVVNLSEGSINRVDIAPLRIAWLHPALKLARRRPTHDFIRQVDAGAFVQIKFIDHLDDAVDAHLQTETIKIAVAGMNDRSLDIGSAVVAHATRKFVPDLNATAANQVGVLERDRALLKSRNGHRNLPGRARRITTLDRTVEQRRLRIVQEFGVLRSTFFARDAL